MPKQIRSAKTEGDIKNFLERKEFKFIKIQLASEIGDQSRMSTNPNTIAIRTNLGQASVNLCESFGCCGKSYMYSFDLCENAYMNKALIKACEIEARRLGYTYIGFIHKTDSKAVELAKALGYKKALGFKNKRSGNTLSEMYKIL